MITCRKCKAEHPYKNATYKIGGRQDYDRCCDVGQWNSSDQIFWSWTCDRCLNAPARALLHPHPRIVDSEVEARRRIEAFAGSEFPNEHIAALVLAHMACGPAPRMPSERNDELWLAFYLGRESLRGDEK